MKISLVNLLSIEKIPYKCFYFIPTICWQKDKDFIGLWICWLNVGIYINIKNKDNGK